METNIDLVKKLLDLPWYNLILMSILVIPIFTSTWITLLNTMGITLTEAQKKLVILFIVGLYCLGLTVGKIGHDREKIAERDSIVETLKLDIKEAGGILGFQRIRFKHPSYDDNTLYLIANEYSNVFSVEPIADKNDNTIRDKDDPVGLKLR